MKEYDCNRKFNEYGRPTPARIQQIAPSCKDMAVIPSVTVENTTGMKGLSNCFVHVISNNTTYYIDDKGRITIIWSGPVEVDNYDYATNPLKLRSQTVFDFLNNLAIYYNRIGEYRVFNLSADEPIVSI